MAEITAALVKELRERTGAGMMDCKRALTETGGVLEDAVDWLRKKGLAAAAKKSGRVAAEGLVGVASVPAKAAAVPGVTATTTVYSGQFEIRNSLATLKAVTTAQLADTLILRMTEGTSAALARGELLVDSTTATSKHLAVGDTLPVAFARNGSSTLRIGGIYQTNALIGSYLVSAEYFASHFSSQPPAASPHG